MCDNSFQSKLLASASASSCVRWSGGAFLRVVKIPEQALAFRTKLLRAFASDGINGAIYIAVVDIWKNCARLPFVVHRSWGRVTVILTSTWNAAFTEQKCFKGGGDFTMVCGCHISDLGSIDANLEQNCFCVLRTLPLYPYNPRKWTSTNTRKTCCNLEVGHYICLKDASISWHQRIDSTSYCWVFSWTVDSGQSQVCSSAEYVKRSSSSTHE